MYVESLKELLVKLHSTCYWISIRRTGSVSTHHSENFSRSQSMIDVWVAIRADCRFPLDYLGLWQLSSQLLLIGILLDNREQIVRLSVCVSSGVTPAYQNLCFFSGLRSPFPFKSREEQHTLYVFRIFCNNSSVTTVSLSKVLLVLSASRISYFMFRNSFPIPPYRNDKFTWHITIESWRINFDPTNLWPDVRDKSLGRRRLLLSAARCMYILLSVYVESHE